MPLPLTVGIIVLVVIVAVGVVARLIDDAEEKVERHESVPRDRHDRV